MSKRSQIAMTPEEIRAYIAGQSRVILVSNGPRGFPHAMPMNFAVDDADRLLMTSYKRSQKNLNLARDPKATLLLESGEAYTELKSVMIYATTEIITEPDEVIEAMVIIARKYGTKQLTDEDTAMRVRQSTKRAILRFTPVQYISWDHAKLGGQY
jgi:nitroimidazol reductase NimA-like FMN-containing flavoprotein (pyridoxamine 5'-phosphate oxidase superfamily)